MIVYFLVMNRTRCNNSIDEIIFDVCKLGELLQSFNLNNVSEIVFQHQ